MENQPPRLPWFRLATMVRQDADSPPQPAFPPVRAPVVPVPLPRVTPSLAPNAVPQPVARPVSRDVQQEVPKQVVETKNGSMRPAPSPPPSPKVIKSSSPTPPPSPKVAPQLPPVITGGNNSMANPEPETARMDRLKSIAMEQVEDKKYNTNNNNSNNISNNGNGGNGKNHNNNSKNTNSINMRGIPPPSERKESVKTNESRVYYPPSNPRKNEKDMKVITMAGENVGAFMELGHSHGYSRKMHHTTGNKLTSESKTQEEKTMENNNKNATKGAAQTKPTTSLVNSNVQSINNSVIFNSSCSEQSPGVHLTFKSKSKSRSQS